MTRVFACVSALCALTVTAACWKDETLSAYGAADRTWVLSELDGKPFRAPATLTFPEPGQMAGAGPCNSFSAVMEAPYPWFEAGPLAATRRACPDLPSETEYFRALGEMSLSEVLGDTLILSTPEGRSMVFTAGG
ncbi:META domain-containing protein [uncultured Roseobacter sp.]|uniref:META domain-containing protein n=1 Tax=uncultured Roseobacter sp. TaxID=114847 RepID=UPI0026251AA1|nr:META domain-containing protein [uncultured Roseobacter sp.]